MRKKIFEVMEAPSGPSAWSAAYDIFMIFVILLSVVPLAFKDDNHVFQLIDLLTVSIFIIDYVLRFVTADFRIKKGFASFLIFPFTIMSIIDILCVLPSFTAMADVFKLLKMFRMMRAFKVLRATKILRHSKNILLIADVIREQRYLLGTVCLFAGAYIVVSALIFFNVEPNTFGDFFDALYLAAATLTTIVYGDTYPITPAGKTVAIFSSFFGIAIIALPASIITAGYMSKLSDMKKKRKVDEDNAKSAGQQG